MEKNTEKNTEKYWKNTGKKYWKKIKPNMIGLIILKI